MMKLVKNKKGLSTVIAILIILVTSVVLATSVGIYSSNIFQQVAKKESTTVTNLHLWVNSTGSEGAFMFQNTGEATIDLKEISVRGTKLPTARIYYWRASEAGVTVTGELNVTKNIMTATSTMTIASDRSG